MHDCIEIVYFKSFSLLDNIDIRKIKIVAGEKFDLKFVFDADRVTRPFYETIKSGRIKKDAVYPGTAKGREFGR